MTTLYHVNPNTGNPNICRAQNGGCPFGTPNEHFDTKQEARADYESKMDAATVALQSVQKDISGRRDEKAESTIRKAMVAHTKVEDLTDALMNLSNKLAAEFNTTDGRPPMTDDELAARGAPTRAAMDPIARQKIRESIVPRLLENDDKAVIAAIQRGAVSVVDSDGYPIDATSPEGAKRAFTQLQQEMFGRPVGSHALVGGFIGEVTKVNGDGTYDVKDKRSGKTYTRKEYIKPLAGGRELKAFPEGETKYENTIIAWGQAKIGDSSDPAVNYENRSIVVPNVKVLTDKRKVEIGRAMWEFAGKDLEVFDNADEEQQLNWANARVARYGDVTVTNNQYGISVDTANSSSSTDHFTTKLIEL